MVLHPGLQSLLLALVDDGRQLINCAHVYVPCSTVLLMAPRADLGHGRIVDRCIGELGARASGLRQTEVIEDIG